MYFGIIKLSMLLLFIDLYKARSIFYGLILGRSATISSGYSLASYGGTMLKNSV